MSELTWTIGSALASTLLLLGIALSIGALGFAWLLRGQANAHGLHTRNIGIVAALAVIAGTVLRALLQSAALADEPSAWATMLRPVIFETELGVALRLQLGAGLGFLVAQLLLPRARSAGLLLSTAAAAVLSAAPGLGGHPAAHDLRALALSLSVVHVVGLSIWLGTLAVLTAKAGQLADETLALAVQRFHRVAALGLGAVVVTGVIKLVDTRPPLAALTSTTWGVALLAKLGAFTIVAAFGWWHWRRADAGLANGGRRGMLRSFAAELGVATLLLVATAVLINSSPPERETASGPPANPDAVASRMYRQIASPYCPGMALSSCPSEGAFVLKRRIRERLATQSAEAVMAELVAEFGPEISGTTPAKGLGLLAWLAPFVGIGLGAIGITVWSRRSVQRAAARACK